MRRVGTRSQSSSPLAGQGPRLAVMIGMLVIVAMLMQRARDPAMWRFLTGEASGEPQLRVGDQPPAASLAEQLAERAESQNEAPSQANPSVASIAGDNAAAESLADDVPPPEGSAPPATPPEPGGPSESISSSSSTLPALPPLDLDPEEQEAALEEFSVITDKQALSREDMPAYYRLLHWQRSLSLEDMRKRARRGLLYAQLCQDPDRYRGQLVQLNVRVIRVLEWPQDNSPLGLPVVYDLSAYSDDSMPNSFSLATDALPKGTPLGANIDLPATFYGFLLKTTGYLDRLGKKHLAPLLVGRLVIDSDVLAAAAPPTGEVHFWPWLILGVAVVLVGARLAVMVLANRRPPAVLPRQTLPRDDSPDALPIDDWLVRAESGALPPAINSAVPGETSGSGDSPENEGLDRPERRQT